MKKNSYDISVIVPVYNVGKKLEKCIESISHQTYENYELILVDDGSTDDSGQLCDRYALIDDRITVLHIKNSGPFQARKAGVNAATGVYVTFLDADDWIEYNTFEIALEILQRKNPDIFMYTYSHENAGVEMNLYDEKYYCEEEIKEVIIPKMMYDPSIGRRRLNPSLSCKFTKRDLFMCVTDSVRDRITLGDDALVTYPMVCRADSIYISNKVLYHYTNNEFSCTHMFPLERIDEVKNFQSNLIRLFSDMRILDSMIYQVENYVRSLLAMMVKNWYGIELSPIIFSFPYDSIEQKSRIIIYGAGQVGRSYINELSIRNYVNVVGWADKNYGYIGLYNNMNVINPKKINEIAFDKLLIAVCDENIAVDIKKELINIGISADKIIWKNPIRIV